MKSYRRIAWLLDPHDGYDTFLTIPAETLLQAQTETGGQLARAGLKGKIVIVGGTFPDIDRHLTPLSSPTGELQPGALIHAHMVAELVDKRHINQLETNSLAMKLELMALAALAFLVGWRTRMRGQGLLFGTAATVAIIALDTFVFWYWRIILPVVLALVAWFLGEFTGNHIGRWLGSRAARSRWNSEMKHLLTAASGLPDPVRRRVGAGTRPACTSLKSSVTAIKVGKEYALSDTIDVPAGASIRAVMPSGKTQTIRGPYSGSVADLAKGQKLNERVLSWITNLLRDRAERAKARRVPRGACSRRPQASPGPRCRSPMTVPSASIRGQALQLVREAAQAAERIAIVDVERSRKGDARWERGSRITAWPPTVDVRSEATYTLLVPDLPPRQVTLRVLENAPADDDILAELATRGCRRQFDVWMQVHTKGKAS